jgi:hypothetical protein
VNDTSTNDAAVNDAPMEVAAVDNGCMASATNDSCMAATTDNSCMAPTANYTRMAATIDNRRMTAGVGDSCMTAGVGDSGMTGTMAPSVLSKTRLRHQQKGACYENGFGKTESGFPHDCSSSEYEFWKPMKTVQFCTANSQRSNRRAKHVANRKPLLQLILCLQC